VELSAYKIRRFLWEFIVPLMEKIMGLGGAVSAKPK
jgi:hypothetical protein